MWIETEMENLWKAFGERRRKAKETINFLVMLEDADGEAENFLKKVTMDESWIRYNDKETRILERKKNLPSMFMVCAVVRPDRAIFVEASMEKINILN